MNSETNDLALRIFEGGKPLEAGFVAMILIGASLTGANNWASFGATTFGMALWMMWKVLMLRLDRIESKISN